MFKTINLLSPKSELLLSFQTNKSLISFLSISSGLEVNLNLNGIRSADSDLKIGINQVTQLSQNSVLISAFNLSKSAIIEDLSANDLEYFILEYPTDWESLAAKNELLHEKFVFQSVEGNLLASKSDLLLAKIESKNFQKQTTSEQVRKAILCNYFK